MAHGHKLSRLEQLDKDRRDLGADRTARYGAVQRAEGKKPTMGSQWPRAGGGGAWDVAWPPICRCCRHVCRPSRPILLPPSRKRPSGSGRPSPFVAGEGLRSHALRSFCCPSPFRDLQGRLLAARDAEAARAVDAARCHTRLESSQIQQATTRRQRDGGWARNRPCVPISLPSLTTDGGPCAGGTSAARASPEPASKRREHRRCRRADGRDRAPAGRGAKVRFPPLT
jgi:hypothetical protein